MSSELSIPLRNWFASSGTALTVSIATVLLLLASPRSAAVLYALLAAGALMGMWWVSMRDDPLIWPSRPTWAMLTFAGFALSSIMWSEDPRESLSKPLYLILVIAGTQALIHSCERLTPTYRKRLGFSLIVALVIGLSLAAFEAATHQLLTRTIYTAFPRLYRGLEEHVQVVDGVVLAISETNIKRRIGALTLVVWPLALMITALTPPRRLLGGLSLVAVLAIIMIYVGPHQSSQVAGLLSVAIFVLARLSVALARKTLAAGFVCLVLLALPLVWLAHKADLYEANWLPNTARHRIVIWNATANEVLKAPDPRGRRQCNKKDLRGAGSEGANTATRWSLHCRSDAARTQCLPADLVRARSRWRIPPCPRGPCDPSGGRANACTSTAIRIGPVRGDSCRHVIELWHLANVVLGLDRIRCDRIGLRLSF